MKTFIGKVTESYFSLLELCAILIAGGFTSHLPGWGRILVAMGAVVLAYFTGDFLRRRVHLPPQRRADQPQS